MTDVDDHPLPWYEREREAREPLAAPWSDDVWDDPALLTARETLPAPRRSRVLKWLLLAVVAVAIAAAVVGGVVGLWVIRQINPSGQPGDPTTFVVKDGDTLVSVSERLRAQGFITHSGVFQWYVKRRKPIPFESGYYTLRPRDTMGNIAAALRTSPNATFTAVTFPEGFTVWQMGRRLAERLPRLSAARFVEAARDGQVVSVYLPSGTVSLEGLLFPDTYQVSNGESERQVVARMVKLTERVGRQEGLDDQIGRAHV